MKVLYVIALFLLSATPVGSDNKLVFRYLGESDGEHFFQPVTPPVLGTHQEAGAKLEPHTVIRCHLVNEHRVVNNVDIPYVVFACEDDRRFVVSSLNWGISAK